MNHLQRIRADLLEKRLWPIVLLLVVALAAVPVLLRPDAAAEPVAVDVTTGGDAAPSPEATLAAASTVLGIEPPVAVAGRAPKGERRNPFAGPRTPESAEGGTSGGTRSASSGASSTSSSTSSSTASAAASSPSSSAVSSSSASTPTPTSTPTPSASSSASSTGSAPRVLPAPHHRARGDRRDRDPEPTTYRLLRADVRFDGIALRDVVRLRPLPSARQPAVLYLGPTAGGTGAAFVVSGDAEIGGDGRCRPRARLCTHLILRPGEQATLTVGETVHRLRLLRVRRETTTSKAVAERHYARQSQRGRCVLDVLDFLGYDAERGTVAPHHDTRECEYAIGDDGTVGAR